MDKIHMVQAAAAILAATAITAMVRVKPRPMTPQNAPLSCMCGCLILIILGFMTMVMVLVGVL